MEEHLIIRASIRKSISSCSEQISGRVCGAEGIGGRRVSECAMVQRREILSPNQQTFVQLTQIFLFNLVSVLSQVIKGIDQLFCIYKSLSAVLQ